MPILYLAVLLVFQWAGELIKQRLSLPIPGALVGMLLFLGYLSISSKSPALEKTCTSLINLLPLFFIPAGVGILGYLAELKAYGLSLTIAILVGTIIGFWASLMVLTKLFRSG